MHFSLYCPSTQPSDTRPYRSRRRPGVLICYSEYQKQQEELGIECITQGLDHLSLEEPQPIATPKSNTNGALRSIRKKTGQQVANKKKACFDVFVKHHDGGRPSRAYRLPKELTDDDSPPRF